MNALLFKGFGFVQYALYYAAYHRIGSVYMIVYDAPPREAQRLPENLLFSLQNGRSSAMRPSERRNAK